MSQPVNNPSGGAAQRDKKGLKAHLQTMLDLAPLPMSCNSLGSNPRLLHINEQFTQAFGYTVEDIPTVADWARLAYPEEQYRHQSFAWWNAAIELAVTTDGVIPTREFRIVCKNGSLADVLISARILEDLLLISLVDVTERKQMEEKLRLSEERHRLLAENARDVIWTMEADGSISYVSPSVEAVRGITAAEAMNQPLDEIHPPESLAISLDYFSRLQADLQAGRTPESFRGELEYWCKDGSTFWTEVMAYPLMHPDGTFLQLLGVTRDMSQRRRYEDELRHTKERLEATLNALPDVMFRADQSGCIFEHHAPTSNPFKGSDAGYIGKNFTDVFPKEAARVVMEALSEAAREGKSHGATYALPLDGGGLLWYELSIAAADQGEEFILLSRDITLRKQTEEALEQAQRELLAREIERTQAEARERLLQDMHDGFGSQLTSARIKAEQGQMDQQTMAELLRECMSDLYLVVDTLENSEHSLGDALRFLRNRSQQRLVDSGLALEWLLDVDNLPPLSQKDILQVLRIVQEALNNAIKHARARLIQVEALYHEPDRLAITVRDDGIGFPENLVPGRGLSTLLSRAHNLNGHIHYGRADRGSVVTLTVPLASSMGLLAQAGYQQA